MAIQRFRVWNSKIVEWTDARKQIKVSNVNSVPPMILLKRQVEILIPRKKNELNKSSDLKKNELNSTKKIFALDFYGAMVNEDVASSSQGLSYLPSLLSLCTGWRSYINWQHFFVCPKFLRKFRNVNVIQFLRRLKKDIHRYASLNHERSCIAARVKWRFSPRVISLKREV